VFITGVPFLAKLNQSLILVTSFVKKEFINEREETPFREFGKGVGWVTL
jgi:hypothetical protein